MADKNFGVVIDSTSRDIRRIIDPGAQAELDDPYHVQTGEVMVKVSRNKFNRLGLQGYQDLLHRGGQ